MQFRPTESNGNTQRHQVRGHGQHCWFWSL